MNGAPITFVIDGKTYSIRTGDKAAIRNIPAEDRQQLISLLEVVKQQDSLAKAEIQQTVDRVSGPLAGTTYARAADRPVDTQSPKPERLGSGDVDALMARLVMEDQRDRKPGMTREGLYKILAGLAAVIFLVVIIF